MNKFSFLTQIGMVVVAVMIVLMYIQPKISAIRDIQDLTTQYETETQNVSQVNEDLRSKIMAIEAINPQDSKALGQFMPDEVDEIAVLKDLSTMLELQAITLYDVEYKGSNSQAQALEGALNEYNSAQEYYFTATFSSTYEQLKSTLALFETNNYMLQVSNVKISEGTTDLLTVEINLTTFARAAAPVAVAP